MKTVHTHIEFFLLFSEILEILLASYVIIVGGLCGDILKRFCQLCRFVKLNIVNFCTSLTIFVIQYLSA